MAPKSYFLATGLLAAAANATAVLRAPVLPRQTNSTAEDIFAHVKPSTKLEWHDCYQASWKCAYLTVPLDYQNTTAGTTDVAFIKYVVKEDGEDIIFNPGGPGASGVEAVQGFAESWAKHWPNYNFVGFDPRGVGKTGPVLTCGNVTQDKLHRRAFHIEELRTAWDMNLKDNEACSAANEHTNVKYVGTLAVVQDIMHFTEEQAIAKGKDPKKALVNYYGVSYGTLIGQTLVATYPDRLRRVLIDGNVYGVAHYQGWEPSGTDDYAHGVWIFTQICYHAGGDLCDLARGAKSAEEVKARFDSVVAKLGDTPITQPDGTPFTQTAFLSQIEQLMYRPRADYAKLANLTATIYNAAASGQFRKMIKRETPEQQPASAVQIVTSIDIAGRFPWSSYEEYEAAALRLYNASEYHGVFYSRGNGLNGLGATILPPPSQFFPGFKPIKPSANVLFINTAGDPVTPASSCRQMSPYFAGSGIVIVEGPGHGFQAAPSKCAQDLVAKYWADGTVPSQEVRCVPDVHPDYFFGGDVPDWVIQ